MIPDTCGLNAFHTLSSKEEISISRHVVCFPSSSSLATWRSISSSCSTSLLCRSADLTSSRVAGGEPLLSTSSSWAYNHHTICSSWTKWTEEHLQAYHWHCITQNSLLPPCYAHLSLSLAPDPHLAWLGGHYARGELEEIARSPSVCSPPPLGSLDAAVERGSSSATVWRQVMSSCWWDKLTSTWLRHGLIPARLSPAPKTQKPSWEHHLSLELIQSWAPWLWLLLLWYSNGHSVCPSRVQTSRLSSC